MKRRNKKQKPFSFKEIMDLVDGFDIESNAEKIKEHINKFYENEFGVFEGLLNPYYEPKFDLPIHRYETRIRRKNGRIETYILFSDGSIDMANVFYTDMKIKKGDKVI